MRKTTVVQNTGDAAGSKMTSKSKAALGIPEHQIITWVPFAKEENDNDMLNYWNKAKNEEEGRDIGLHVRVKEVLNQWLEENRATIQEVADTQVKKSEKSIEELEAELARAEKAMTRKMEAIAAKRALLQAK